jgi:acetyl esterase/lipase
MVLVMDTEIAAILAPAGAPSPPPPAPVNDVKSRREQLGAGFTSLIKNNYPNKDPAVSFEEFSTISADGSSIALRWYTKSGRRGGSAAVFIHSGGLILGNVATFEGVIDNLVSNTGVPLLTVEYRLCPEVIYPKPLEDVYAALIFLHDHAIEFGVDPSRIAVYGESAGGCLAAAVSIYAHEKRGPAIAKQILVYPMLDDRVISADPKLAPFLTWSAIDNETGWNAYLGSQRGTDGVPATAAPARLQDPNGLPPLYLEVGELDLFLSENVTYAMRFAKAGISTELHVYPGAPHGYDLFAPGAKVTQAAFGSRFRTLENISKVD